MSGLTHKTLELVVPQWRRPQAVGHQRKESLLHLIKKQTKNKYYKSTPLVNCGTRSVKFETEIKKEVPYLKCCVKDDQFGAGGNGVVAVVSLHEVGVDERVGICACRGH